MSLRHMLLIGTSLGLLAFSPQVASAADGGLQNILQTYVAAQKSGDKGALAKARNELMRACRRAGENKLQACIATIEGGGRPAVHQKAGKSKTPAPNSEAGKEAAPQAAPAAKPAPAKAAKPAPTAKPSPSAPDIAGEFKTAVDAYNGAIAAYAAAAAKGGDLKGEKRHLNQEHARIRDICVKSGIKSVKACLDKYGLALQPIPRGQQKPEASQPKAQEPKAGQSKVNEAAPAPAPKAGPATKPQPANAKPESGAPGIAGELKTSVDAYNGAIAAYAAAQAKGSDVNGAERKLRQERARIRDICVKSGIKSVKACLDKYGLELQPVPRGQQKSEGAQPKTEQPQAQQGQSGPAPAGQAEVPKETVKTLPKGVTEQEVAPVFDSAKSKVPPGTKPENANAAPPPKTAGKNAPAQPAPNSDASAQAHIGRVKVPPVEERKGKAIKAPPVLVLPPGVTIVQQENGGQQNGQNASDRSNRDRNGNNQGRGTSRNNGQSPDRSQNHGQPNQINPFNFRLFLNIGGETEIRDPRQDYRRIAHNPKDRTTYDELSGGRIRETIRRPDGSRIVTVRNRRGDILRRTRITPDGRQYVLAYVDPRDQDKVDSYGDPGANLPPLRLNIPLSDYVMDADQASPIQIQRFLDQPPIEQLPRIYSINEVKHSARIRDMARRLEISDLTFATGSAVIPQDEVDKLSSLAHAMENLLARNPAETFLIEGHTDAVGSPLSNLALSQERADTVANVLTDIYDIPPENLVTQGYGERFLKIDTQGPERANRRVTIRRITPLITPVAGG